MSFAKLISRTSDAGSARYTLKAPGELNPNHKYYWHVRAKDAHGVWGDWSQTWSFTPRGPAPPLNVRLEYDSEKNVGTLHWDRNPLGRQPVAYRVYASDEKGFSISDEPFEVVAGVYDAHQRESNESPAQFPANFLAQTRATELTVVGQAVELASANKAYYRVVAVDDAGNLSGPSDYAESLRPVIYSKPVLQADVGAEYDYQVQTIRSIGDLRTRVIDGREVMKYWDVERPSFQIEQGPTWLAVDKTTGRLSGKPDRAGTIHVVVAVDLEHQQRRLDPGQLQWGVEKILDNTTETVGIAKQEFEIEVSP